MESIFKKKKGTKIKREQIEKKKKPSAEIIYTTRKGIRIEAHIHE